MDAETKPTEKSYYHILAEEVATTVVRKQAAYGDSFSKAGEVLEILYPEGVRLDQYHDMLAIVRIIDKLFRIANHKSAFGESPYLDLAGYGLLGAAENLHSKPTPSDNSWVEAY